MTSVGVGVNVGVGVDVGVCVGVEDGVGVKVDVGGNSGVEVSISVGQGAVGEIVAVSVPVQPTWKAVRLNTIPVHKRIMAGLLVAVLCQVMFIDPLFMYQYD